MLLKLLCDYLHLYETCVHGILTRHEVELIVKASTGGIWRFPVKFIATEPEPDDTIIIEAAGLNKQSTVGFRLSSQNRSVSVLNNFSFFCRQELTWLPVYILTVHGIQC